MNSGQAAGNDSIYLDEKNMKQSYVYILKCSDNSYYTGVTSDLESRMFKHNSGFYPESYTSGRRPLQLVFYCEFTDINVAIDTEKQIKKWSRAKKEALINGDFEALVNLAKKKFDK
jgi:putative endonuclease